MTERRFWTLRLAEPLASRNEDPPLALSSNSDESTEVLSEWWGISSAEELVDTLQWLRDEGHRDKFRQSEPQAAPHAYLAWDVARLSQLVRWGVRAGFLDTASAWTWLDEAGAMAAQSFTSWPAYLDDYELGFRAWKDDAEERAKVAGFVAELKASALPSWNPPDETLPSPLAYRWKSWRKKTSLSAQLRTAFIALLCLGASVMQPWPLGAACAGAFVVTMALSGRLWGATAELLLGLCGLGLVGTSVVGGYFRDYVPESKESLVAALLFAALTAYTAASVIIYSDDRTPAPD